MAVRGLIRPMSKSPMLITGIRCLYFAPPEFLLGKLPKVGFWVWGVTTECPCRGLPTPALISAGQDTRGPFLQSPGPDVASHTAHRTNAAQSPPNLFETRP